VNFGVRCVAMCSDSCTALLLGFQEQKKCNCRTKRFNNR